MAVSAPTHPAICASAASTRPRKNAASGMPAVIVPARALASRRIASTRDQTWIGASCRWNAFTRRQTGVS